MLDAVPGVDDAAAVVEPDGDGEHDRPLRIAKALGDGIRDVGIRPGEFELGDRRLEERRVPLEVRLCSGFLDLGHGGSVRTLAAPIVCSSRGCRGRESNPHGREASRF